MSVNCSSRQNRPFVPAAHQAVGGGKTAHHCDLVRVDERVCPRVPGAVAALEQGHERNPARADRTHDQPHTSRCCDATRALTVRRVERRGVGWRWAGAGARQEAKWVHVCANCRVFRVRRTLLLSILSIVHLRTHSSGDKPPPNRTAVRTSALDKGNAARLRRFKRHAQIPVGLLVQEDALEDAPLPREVRLVL